MNRIHRMKGERLQQLGGGVAAEVEIIRVHVAEEFVLGENYFGPQKWSPLIFVDEGDDNVISPQSLGFNPGDSFFVSVHGRQSRPRISVRLARGSLRLLGLCDSLICHATGGHSALFAPL